MTVRCSRLDVAFDGAVAHGGEVDWRHDVRWLDVVGSTSSARSSERETVLVSEARGVRLRSVAEVFRGYSHKMTRAFSDQTYPVVVVPPADLVQQVRCDHAADHRHGARRVVAAVVSDLAAEVDVREPPLGLQAYGPSHQTGRVDPAELAATG